MRFGSIFDIKDNITRFPLHFRELSEHFLFFLTLENNAPNERNTIVFKLHVQCAKDLEEEKGQSKKKKEEKKVPPRITGIVLVLYG